MKHSIAVSALIAVASSKRNNLNLLSIRYPDEEIRAPEIEFFPIIEDDSRYALNTCWEENMTFVDSGNDGCEWYGLGTNYLTCGNYDTDDFNARRMCCACGGGSDTPYPYVLECVN